VIEKYENYSLHISEIKYAFQTLLTIAGIPWLFLPEQATGPIDIYFGIKPPNRSFKLFIEMSDVKRNNLKIPKEFFEENGIVWPLFNSDRKNICFTRNPQDTIHDIHIYDIILPSFYLLSGWQEQFIHLDSKGIHKIEEIPLYQNKLLHTPIVNQYALFLRDIFQETHNFIPPWPGNKKYALALSHDVDYPLMIRWIEAFIYMAKFGLHSQISKIINIFKGEESFWKFDDWIKLEQSYNMKSAFYFCGLQGNLIRYFLKAPDPFYDVQQENFKRIMRLIDNKNFEVGMHSSYFAYSSFNQFLKEKLQVEKSLGKPIFGNRHHYWHMNPNNPSETALIHEKIGLIYDSSICFDKHSGFRYSICSPFHLYDRIGNKPVSTLQLPPALMDDHLFGLSKYCHFESYQSHIDSLIDSIKKYNGVFVADYHVRGLNTTFYLKFGESYKYLLKKVAADNNFYCDTPINIARYWLEREHKIFKRSKDEDCDFN